MEKMIETRSGIGSGAMLRCVLAAAAIATMAFAPHADAQRREARPAAAAAAVASDDAVAPSAEGVVNIQTASVEELQRLPGIGPSKAEAIVAFRDRTPFRRVEDILRVRGIGRATFRRLRPMLSVQGPTTLTTDVRMPRAPRAAAGEDEESAD